MFLDKTPKNDNLITYDYGHLSLSGSIYVANNIIEKLKISNNVLFS